MVVIKSVNAKSILDSRKEKTIFVSIKTNAGVFSASAPNGKSKGKHEVKSYKKSLEEDIKTLKEFTDYFSEDIIEKFEDLRRIEDIMDRQIGANTLFALESAVLKALAKEKKKEIWQLINPKSKTFPRLVGNCIGGGKHSENYEKIPDFQEFLLIPKSNSVAKSSNMNNSIKNNSEMALKKSDDKFKSKKNDEGAWIVSLDDKSVFDLLNELKEYESKKQRSKIDMGMDVASSGFYKRKRYSYQNPLLNRSEEEQFKYLSNLIKNFNLFYIEDPFHEDDFENFAKLLKKFPKSLIVGDDLTVTNSTRFEKAIQMKSVNAIIVKPNQCGSLIEVKRVCELAKENKIKIIFSHRSGETNENILADLAFGFHADFLKCGITGIERETKIKRLIEIEKKLK